MMGDDRAVSEVLGYVLTFALVIGAVALLFVVGFGTVGDLRDAEQVNNGERAMIALSESINDLAMGRGPKREGELRLSGGTMAYNGSTMLSASVSGSNPPVPETAILSGALVYRLTDRSISYTGGAIIRSGPEASILTREPAFRCSASNTIVSSVSLALGSNSAQSHTGRGSVLVVGTRSDTNVIYRASGDSSGGPKTVTITVSSDNDAAWDRYLTGSGWVATGTDDEYECVTERLLVRETVVDIRILS